MNPSSVVSAARSLQAPNGSLASYEKGLNRFAWAALVISVFFIARATAGGTIAFLSVLCVGLSFIVSRQTCEVFVFRRITITSFWYVTYLAMILLPAFWVYADQDGAYRGRYLFAVESVLITVPLGWKLACFLSGFRKSETELFFRKPVSELRYADALRRRYLLCLGLAAVFTILYFRDVSTIPLVYLFHNPGDYLVLANLREDSLKLLNSPFTYFYYVTRGVLYPFLILVSLGCYLQERASRWRWMFGVTGCLGLLFASLSLAKSPVAAIFAMIGFFWYFYRGGRVGFRVVATLVICVLLFPIGVILSVSYGTNVSLLDALRGIGTRMFYMPASVVYYYFEVFPIHVGYLHGASIAKLAWLLGWRYFDTAAYVGQYAFLGSVQSVIANGAFIGDLNADFGLSGVLLGGILTGWVMQAFHIFVVRKEKTVHMVACYAFLVFAFWLLNSTSLPIVLASNGALLVVVMARWLERRPHSASRNALASAPVR